MIDRLRRIRRGARTVWAGLAVVYLIPWLVIRLVTAGFALLLQGSRARWRFQRALRRSGLARKEVNALSGVYDPAIPVRHILRERRVRRLR